MEKSPPQLQTIDDRLIPLKLRMIVSRRAGIPSTR